MNTDLEAKWREIQEIDPSMSRADFDALYRNLSGYQDGVNDGLVEDFAEIRKAGGDKAVSGLLDDLVDGNEDLRAHILEGGDEAVQKYLDENGIEANVAETRTAGAEAALAEFKAGREVQAWGQGSDRRFEAQSDGMKLQTSTTSQWTHTGDAMTGGEYNGQAAEGLQPWQAFAASQTAMPDTPTGLTSAKSAEQPSDWRITAANRLNPKSAESKEKTDDGPEVS